MLIEITLSPQWWWRSHTIRDGLLIMKCNWKLGSNGKRTFDTPVVGRLDDELTSTSENVHLYFDSKSFSSRCPILYADCEDIQNDDSLSKIVEGRSEFWSKSLNVQYDKGKVKAIRNFADRSLYWIKSDHVKKRRSYSVRNLFSRILYTFSDVIVFVLRAQKWVFPFFWPADRWIL